MAEHAIFLDGLAVVATEATAVQSGARVIGPDAVVLALDVNGRLRWESGYYPNAVFWCLSTAEPIGPDDGLVHPHACIEPRVCFCASSPAVLHDPLRAPRS